MTFLSFSLLKTLVESMNLGRNMSEVFLQQEILYRKLKTSSQFDIKFVLKKVMKDSKSPRFAFENDLS